MDKVLDKVVQAFPKGIDREDARKICERWHEPGYCAKAALYGMADRPSMRRYRSAICAAVNAAPADGFTVSFQKEFGGSVESAELEMKSAVEIARVLG